MTRLLLGFSWGVGWCRNFSHGYGCSGGEVGGLGGNRGHRFSHNILRSFGFIIDRNFGFRIDKESGRRFCPFGFHRDLFIRDITNLPCNRFCGRIRYRWFFRLRRGGSLLGEAEESSEEGEKDKGS